MLSTSPSAIQLSSGYAIPRLGFGTYRLRGDAVKEAVRAAVKTGYRLLDTATVYRNEHDIGATVNELVTAGVVRRDELFISTKISPRDHGYHQTLAAVQASLTNLKTTYIDLVLIHWPATARLKLNDVRHASARADTYRALERCVGNGIVRSIGISNYTVDHLLELLNQPGLQIPPAVHQYEMHPLHCPDDIRKICDDHNIVVQAYSSLAEGWFFSSDNPCTEVANIAKDIGKTQAQILLRWAIQKQVLVIPKSAHVDRIRENADIWDFTLNSQVHILYFVFEKINGLTTK